MQDNGAPEPTADPVELERKLQAQQAGLPEPGSEAQQVEGWTFVRKVAVALSLALVVGYLVLWAQNVQQSGGPDGYIRGTEGRGPVDFISQLTGALILNEGNGTRLYDLDIQRDAQNRIFEGYRPALTTAQILPFNHVPFEALLLAPLMDLPYPLVFALWTLLSGVAVGMSLGMLDASIPVPRPVGWVMSLAACSYLPLIRGLMLGQNSALVLLGLVGLYVSLKRGQYGWAGAWLALAALKPQVLPVVLLAVALMGYWRTLATFAGILVGLTVLAMPFLGASWPVEYARLLRGVANWGSTAAIDPGIMHNWRGFFANLLGQGGEGLVLPLFVVMSVVSAGLVVWVWMRMRAQTRTEDEYGYEDDEPEDYSYRPRHDLYWALVGVVAVLTSLHLNPHDLTLLIFPAWILGAYATSGLWSARLSRGALALLWAGYAAGIGTLVAQREVVIPSVLIMVGVALFAARQLVAERADESEARHLALSP
ncbi:MAG TPA: glycosyltransferase family 87 protein [Chloroflexia bacterium]|nr:glycosyltransferase family 87 protein [Chloroflexia bacterium]